MPTTEQHQPRRPSSTRSGKSGPRPHSRTASASSTRGNAHGFGGFTTIAPTANVPQTGLKPDKPKNIRRKSGTSVKAVSPERPTPPPVRNNADDTRKAPTSSSLTPKKAKTKAVEAAAAQDEEDDWESSESGAVTPNPEFVTGQEDDVAAALRQLKLHEQLQAQHAEQMQKLKEQEIMKQQERTPLPIQVDSRTPSPVHRPPPVLTILNRTSSPGNGSQGHSRSPSAQLPTSPHPSVHHHHHHHHHQKPHPLIRQQSYASAPLTAPPYLTAQFANAQLRASPPAPSPLSTSPENTAFSARPPSSRKTSFSSSRSVSTLPVPSIISTKINAPGEHDSRRERTISALSTRSSSAALSSLAAIPGHHSQIHHSHHPSSRPPSPPLTSRFPLHETDPNIHPLLPDPYLKMHLTITKFYDPLQEAFMRVADAKVRSRLQ